MVIPIDRDCTGVILYLILSEPLGEDHLPTPATLLSPPEEVELAATAMRATDNTEKDQREKDQREKDQREKDQTKRERSNKERKIMRMWSPADIEYSHKINMWTGRN